MILCCFLEQTRQFTEFELFALFHRFYQVVGTGNMLAKNAKSHNGSNGIADQGKETAVVHSIQQSLEMKSRN